jgi:hypothetical protein
LIFCTLVCRQKIAGLVEVTDTRSSIHGVQTPAFVGVFLEVLSRVAILGGLVARNTMPTAPRGTDKDMVQFAIAIFDADIPGVERVDGAGPGSFSMVWMCVVSLWTVQTSSATYPSPVWRVPHPSFLRMDPRRRHQSLGCPTQWRPYPPRH